MHSSLLSHSVLPYKMRSEGKRDWKETPEPRRSLWKNNIFKLMDLVARKEVSEEGEWTARKDGRVRMKDQRGNEMMWKEGQKGQGCASEDEGKDTFWILGSRAQSVPPLVKMRER